MSELPKGSMTRPEWMRRHGAKIYEEWATEMLQACDTPSFWEAYRGVAFQRIITNHGIPDLNRMIDPLANMRVGAIQKVDARHGISSRLLTPRADEILHYTAAAEVGNRLGLKSPGEIIAAHAHDSLQFSLGFSIGVANDTALEHHGEFEAHRRDLEIDQHIARLQFAARALQNSSFIEGLQEMRISGFGAIGMQASRLLETKPQDPGWLTRAPHRKDETYNPNAPVTAAMMYDSTSGTFTPEPVMLKHLRSALGRQNRKRLIPDEADSLSVFELPISRGCPVREAIGTVALFASRAVTEVYEATLAASHRET